MTMAADSWALRSSGAARARWEQFASSTLLRWDFMVLDGADTTRFSVEHATVQFQALITESRTIVAHRLLSEPEVVSALSHGTELRVRQRIFTIASPKGNGFELKGASAWLRAVQASNRRVVAERQSATERLIASAMMLIPPISAPDAFGERESGADSVDRDPSEHASRVYKAAEAIPGMGPPAYPKALKSSGVEGEAIVQFIVDTTGRAELPSFTVLRATHILFGDAVKAALPRMRFLPAEIDGRKVRMRVTQNFSFALTKK